MINIPLIRLLNQQLVSPIFGSPLEVVDWMGAVQAQDPRAARWAIGLRMKLPALSTVEQALDEGLIVRTHCHASYMAYRCCTGFAMDAHALPGE